MTAANSEVTRQGVAEIEKLIRPYVRRTPVLAVDLADFGPDYEKWKAWLASQQKE